MAAGGEGGAELLRRMREDWDARAREDAHYYVAFGGRGQSEGEFFDTAGEIATSLIAELRRLPPDRPLAARRFLEIGCGPGRLMLPLSRHCGEIHGVDVSEEMVALARRNLRGVAHAHAHLGSGATLAAFACESFDFIYSYAVFQHIPSAEVVFSYLDEAVRVLRPGGVLRVQLNGLPETPAAADTWSGARIQAVRLREFAARNPLRLLALEGSGTQYLWATFAKLKSHSENELPENAQVNVEPAAIVRITNSHSSEPAAPAAGRFAAASLWVKGLPAVAGLLSLEVRFRGLPGEVTFLGPPPPDGLSQVNVLLPPGLSAGLAPVELFWNGTLLGAARLRILPTPPPVPRVLSVRDGVNLSFEGVSTSGTLKVTVEEVAAIDSLTAQLDGMALVRTEVFSTDPRIPKHEINFQLPPEITPGRWTLTLAAGGRKFPARSLQVLDSKMK